MLRAEPITPQQKMMVEEFPIQDNHADAVELFMASYVSRSQPLEGAIRSLASTYDDICSLTVVEKMDDHAEIGAAGVEILDHGSDMLVESAYDFIAGIWQRRKPSRYRKSEMYTEAVLEKMRTDTWKQCMNLYFVWNPSKDLSSEYIFKQAFVELWDAYDERHPDAKAAREGRSLDELAIMSGAQRSAEVEMRAAAEAAPKVWSIYGDDVDPDKIIEQHVADMKNGDGNGFEA